MFKKDILNIFRAAFLRDQAQFIESWLVSWPYQEDPKAGSGKPGMPNNFFAFEGKEEYTKFLNWALLGWPDYFPDQVTKPLIMKSVQLDERILRENGLIYDSELLARGIARSNAQDYILMNAYPMTGPQVARKVLDFGAGLGRQANLWTQMEDDSLLYVAIDAIPKCYCTQHFYFSNIDKPYYDYVLDGDSLSFGQSSRGICHLPTWRMDLLPDNYFDKIAAIQVLQEIHPRCVEFVLKEFRRVIKPSGQLYIRDHKRFWRPVHDFDVDGYLQLNGFTKEFEPHIQDRVDLHGIPRIFRKTNPKIGEMEKEAARAVYR